MADRAFGTLPAEALAAHQHAEVLRADHHSALQGQPVDQLRPRPRLAPTSRLVTQVAQSFPIGGPHRGLPFDLLTTLRSIADPICDFSMLRGTTAFKCNVESHPRFSVTASLYTSIVSRAVRCQE